MDYNYLCVPFSKRAKQDPWGEGPTHRQHVRLRGPLVQFKGGSLGLGLTRDSCHICRHCGHNTKLPAHVDPGSKACGVYSTSEETESSSRSQSQEKLSENPTRMRD